MHSGLLSLPWWGYVGVTLVFTHLTIICVTIFLHRHQAHRAVDLHPAVAHLMRSWLWLTTGMRTHQWVAVHRKHHACVETMDDPHSPQVHGLRKVLLEGAELYRLGANDEASVARYSYGTPDDWVERNVYRRWPYLGVSLMLVADVVLFGPIGLTMWAVQMIWIPFFAAGVINGLAHWGGYRNFETLDAATNIIPWGILVGGEELHNNHHAFASSARFSYRAFEFDAGWFYIRLLSACGLARVRKLPPVPLIAARDGQIDAETLTAVVQARLHVMADYARRVVDRVHHEELTRGDNGARHVLAPIRSLLVRNERLMNAHQREALVAALAHSKPLETVYEFKQRLLGIVAERAAGTERMASQLQDWCQQAEKTGVAALEEFAERLRRYSLAPVRV